MIVPVESFTDRLRASARDMQLSEYWCVCWESIMMYLWAEDEEEMSKLTPNIMSRPAFVRFRASLLGALAGSGYPSILRKPASGGGRENLSLPMWSRHPMM